MNPRCLFSLLALALVMFSSAGCNQKPGHTAQSNSASIAKKSDVDAELARIRAAGEPTDFNQLDSLYVTPSENAADVYGKAFAALTGNLNQLLSLEVHLPAVTSPLPKALQTSLASILAQNKTSLALLHQAAAIKECRYPVDLKDGAAASMLHWEKITKCAQLLELEAVKCAEQGQTNDSVDAVIDLLKLGGSLKSEPVSHSQWIRMRCSALSFVAAQQLLNRVQLNEDQLSRLIVAFRDAENLNAPARACSGERTFAAYIIQLPPDQQFKYVNSIGFALPPGSSFATDDLLYCLTVTKEFIADSSASIQQYLSACAKLKSQIDFAADHNYSFTTKVLAPFVEVLDTMPADISRLRCVQNALAIQSYRLTHQGNCPTALAELVPGIPETFLSDPCTGKNFQYRQTGSGYTLASSDPANDTAVTFQVTR